MADSSAEKTEEATPKRKRDERKKGNVFTSQEITTVASLLAVFFTMYILAGFIGSQLEGSLIDYFHLCATVKVIKLENVFSIAVRAIIAFALGTGPMLIVACLCGVIFTMGQTKGLVSFEAIKPKFSKLNPLSGIKNMVSMQGMVNLLKSMIKIIVLGIILWNVISGWLPTLPKMFSMSMQDAVVETGSIIFSIIVQAGVAFIALAVLDFLYQWWNYNKKLRMSKEEVKEEYKQTEGDPKIKGKIREKQQSMSRMRMMQDVPGADVVIRNPTHYAVAIKYDRDLHEAPVVLAKGKDHLALKIIEVAEEAGVTIIENRPLARALYEGVDLEKEIPENFYEAVAEILAFVYSLKEDNMAPSNSAYWT